ncbi:MAG: hypothetical protein IPH07_09370 [Deltaproteobacteria bacterium]|nr:hypothetical protein [Deltaproteobacteria bacterium]MBK8719154.1 hypothetical protein [Deltaproteobacteria bacterium]MBP7289805.1 hypothetical protein [Nannocystaceae bacterium]
MITRRHAVLGLAAALASCKRRQQSKVAEVWDEEPVPEQSEALAALAPPWPAPTRGTLDDGLVTFWLHEPGAVMAHVRLLLPTGGLAPAPSPESIAIAGEYLRFEWQRRLQKQGITVQLQPGPDRLEVCASGPGDRLPNVLAQLGSTLALRSANPLESARVRLSSGDARPTNLELATAATVAQLLGHHDLVQLDRLRALGRQALLEPWQRLADPLRGVLIVHAGGTADAAKPELRRLSELWRSSERSDTVAPAIARLRARDEAPASTGTRLLAAPPTPLSYVEGRAGGGEAILVLGRTLPLADASTRALARLAQRVAQEEIDASLVVAGDRAVWIVAAVISRSAVERDLGREVAGLAALAGTRQPRQRLFQAAQLYLGARVVEASLGGEDWTRLFAQSIDLAESDPQIAGAMAKDAAAMLAATPAALETWTRSWLEPRKGEPGWAWTVAGLDAQARAQAAKLVPVVAFDGPAT